MDFFLLFLLLKQSPNSSSGLERGVITIIAPFRVVVVVSVDLHLHLSVAGRGISFCYAAFH